MGDKKLLLSLASRPREREEPRDEKQEMLDAAAGALLGAIENKDKGAVAKIFRDFMSINKE